MKVIARIGVCFMMLIATGLPGVSHTQPDELAQSCLQAHNLIRARLGEPGLQWSKRLATEAQWWANVLTEKNAFEHEPYRRWGQNLFLIDGAYSTPAEAIDAWASEVSVYDPRQNRCTGGMCGHYTQIVWKDTRQVGCAHAWRGMREVWVCDYYPPGNVVGERPY